MIALRRNATEVTHEDYMDAILEVQAKKKTNLNYYAQFIFIITIILTDIIIFLKSKNFKTATKMQHT